MVKDFLAQNDPIYKYVTVVELNVKQTPRRELSVWLSEISATLKACNISAIATHPRDILTCIKRGRSSVNRVGCGNTSTIRLPAASYPYTAAPLFETLADTATTRILFALLSNHIEFPEFAIRAGTVRLSRIIEERRTVGAPYHRAGGHCRGTKDLVSLNRIKRGINKAAIRAHIRLRENYYEWRR